jgi:hypothetical protein
MINTLPEDIVHYIYNFVPYHIKCLLSAKNYEKYNKYHLEYMDEFVYGNKLKLGKKFTFDTYVRRLIKNDNYYVFKFVLLDNFKIWKKMKKKRYKNFNYKSKLLFYSFYCIENKSNKCLEKIKEYL